MSHFIRIYTDCHSGFHFRLKPFFLSVDVQIQRWESPLQKLRNERVNQNEKQTMNSWMLGYYKSSRVERKTVVTQTYFLKLLFRGNLDPFVNNANLGAIAHTKFSLFTERNVVIFITPSW